MPVSARAGDIVLDASAAAKCLFEEPGSDAARLAAATAERIFAPEFAVMEIASVAVKKARRKEITPEQAREVVRDARDLFDTLVSTADLAPAAADVALSGMASAYDAAYAALAAQRGALLVTADKRFAASLRGARGAPDVQIIDA